MVSTYQGVRMMRPGPSSTYRMGAAMFVACIFCSDTCNDAVLPASRHMAEEYRCDNLKCMTMPPAYICSCCHGVLSRLSCNRGSSHLQYLPVKRILPLQYCQQKNAHVGQRLPYDCLSWIDAACQNPRSVCVPTQDRGMLLTYMLLACLCLLLVAAEESDVAATYVL
jgi:hypothetical protein